MASLCACDRADYLPRRCRQFSRGLRLQFRCPRVQPLLRPQLDGFAAPSSSSTRRRCAGVTSGPCMSLDESDAQAGPRTEHSAMPCRAEFRAAENFLSVALPSPGSGALERVSASRTHVEPGCKGAYWKVFTREQPATPRMCWSQSSSVSYSHDITNQLAHDRPRARNQSLHALVEGGWEASLQQAWGAQCTNHSTAVY